MGVCFRKWKDVFENRSVKVEVCFPKSELKIRICCRKSEFDVRRESLELWSKTVRRVRCLDIDEMEVNAEATTTRKQPF